MVREKIEVNSNSEATLDNITLDNTTDVVNNLSKMTLPEKNVATYISGYLVYRIKKKHECQICDLRVIHSNDKSVQNESQKFLYWKALCKSSGDFGGLTIPSELMVKFVTRIEQIFIDNFDHICHMDKISQRLLNITEKDLTNKQSPLSLLNNHLCNHAIKSITLMYVRLRIKSSLKCFNTNLIECKKHSSKVSRKSMKVLHL